MVVLILGGGVGGSAGGADLCTALEELGVSKSQAKRLVEQHDPDRIREVMDFYQWALEHGQAEGVGYLVSALEEDWGPPAGYVPPEGRCAWCGYPWEVDRQLFCDVHRTWRYSPPEVRESRVAEALEWARSLAAEAELECPS